MGDFGIKSSKDGEDVKSAADKDKTFFSKYEHPKVKIYADPPHFDYLTYTFSSEPGNGTTTLYTKAHGLGYQPAHLSMIGFSTGAFSFLPYYSFSIGPFPTFTVSEDYIYAYTDATNWYVKLNRTNGGPSALNGVTLNFKYNIWAADGS